MDLLASTGQKVEAMLDTVRALRAGEFPLDDARAALEEIDAIFVQHKAQLLDLADGTAPNAAPTYCATVVEDLFAYLPVVGFLHRSRSSSNAFELYGPLRRLARAVIGESTRLVLSSEWDFSPYTLLQMPGLPSLVLLGLPASESRNVLLAPLAGHEFGHSIWVEQEASQRYASTLDEGVVRAIRMRWDDYHLNFPFVEDGTLTTDLFAVQTWLPAARWAMRQCEELFCDLVGLRVFGESYFHAFAYLIAPGPSAERHPLYPTVPQRVAFLIQAAAKYGISVPKDYAQLFPLPPASPASPNAFLISIADEAVESQVDTLIEHVEAFLIGKSIPIPADVGSQAIFRAVQGLVPAPLPASLAAIVNAGWQAAHDRTLWSTYQQISGDKGRVLNELLLKTAQVLEVNERLKENP